MIRMKKAAKLWLRVLALAMALLLLCGGTVSAADMDDVPYYSYCYWEGPSRTVAVPMRAMYEATHQINAESLGLLDLYRDAVANGGLDSKFGMVTDNAEAIELGLSHVVLTHDQSELYALDSTNGRIMVIDAKTLELKRIIGSVPLTGESYGVAAYQDIAVKANTAYTLTWYTRRDIGKNAYQVSVLNGTAPIALEGEATFDHAYDAMQEWVEHTVTFNSGDATEVRLQFESKSTAIGTFYVDSISMVAADDAGTNLVQNGEFDGGTTDNGADKWTVSLGAEASDQAHYSDEHQVGALRLSNGLDYAKASGIYVTKDGQLLICDTENRRVLVVDGEGELKHIITKPEGIEIPEELDFTPTRIIMDNKGYLYLSAGEACYYGLLVYDEQYNFKGFHGAYAASSGLLETLSGLITNLFMTNEKAEGSKKNYGTGVIDIAIDGEGLLYTLSDPASHTGQIKRMGLNGTQTLNFKSGFTTQSGDLLNFVEQPGSYFEKGSSFRIMSNLNSLAVDQQGFIYAADSGRSRVYMFDEECRMLTGFSLSIGGNGTQLGTFHTPVALAVSEDRLFVADSGNKNITVFELTEYGRLCKAADVLTINGEYEEALPLWEQVLKLDANNQRAYEGIAKAYLAREDYDQAMYYAEKGNDQQTYSLAYTEVQKVWLSNNFWWIFILCLVAVGGIAAILVISKKRKIFEIKNVKLRTALAVPFHPFQSFQALRTQKATSLLLACIFVVVFYIARVSQDLYGGFMYIIVDKANYNALFTLFGSVGILMLWVVTNWGICMLNDGKGSFMEVFCMSAYSMMPMIAYSVIFTVGSHVIPATNTDSFGMIGTILTIYMALLLLIGMTVVHEYSFFKSIGMAIVTVICMALAVFVLCSVVLLSQQFIMFIVSIVEELRVR
ncbi:MAG: YIP1 family protein [Clostridia bacterium]|nr:YIP1 family protein [Clostridia bacterium]